jgi:hypothetical protein
MFISDKIDIISKLVIWEGHYILIKGVIHRKDVMIINIYIYLYIFLFQNLLQTMESR